MLLRDYYLLTKPGIIYGNALTATAGFFLASRGHFDGWLLFAMLLGLSLIIASSCVINNYIDRDIDKLMERTKDRALVRGVIKKNSAMYFAGVLFILGICILGYFTTLLALLIALLGFIVYILFYSLWGKRRSLYGTVIGSIAGATPPVVGYVAVTHNFDLAALLLFLILCFWQMPHFFAIAIYRFEDYTNAKVPVLPIVRGLYATKLHMVFYIIAFTISLIFLTLSGYTGRFFLGTVPLLGLIWLYLCLKGFTIHDRNGERQWARRMFLFSIIIIFAFCVMIAIDVQK